MSRRQKLIDKARNNPAGVRFLDLCLLAERLGFRKRGGMGKPYQVRQFLSVIDKYRLGEEE